MIGSEDDTTDQHIRLLAYFAGSAEGAPLAMAAKALGTTVADVERLAADLAAAGMIEPVTVQ